MQTNDYSSAEFELVASLEGPSKEYPVMIERAYFDDESHVLYFTAGETAGSGRFYSGSLYAYSKNESGHTLLNSIPAGKDFFLTSDAIFVEGGYNRYSLSYGLLKIDKSTFKVLEDLSDAYPAAFDTFYEGAMYYTDTDVNCLMKYDFSSKRASVVIDESDFKSRYKNKPLGWSGYMDYNPRVHFWYVDFAGPVISYQSSVVATTGYSVDDNLAWKNVILFNGEVIWEENEEQFGLNAN